MTRAIAQHACNFSRGILTTGILGTGMVTRTQTDVAKAVNASARARRSGLTIQWAADSEAAKPDAMAAAAESKQNSRESSRESRGQLTKDARLRGDEDDMSCLGADMG
jgi:hypothetical protein